MAVVATAVIAAMTGGRARGGTVKNFESLGMSCKADDAEARGWL